MRHSIFALIFALLAAVALFAAQAAEPRYETFPVSEGFSGKAVAPKLATHFEREFRSQILAGSSARSDFAGHYHVVPWGCGANCVQFVIVDSATGAVYDPPFRSVSWSGARGQYRVLEGVHYRTDSRLLTVAGCPDGDQSRCGTYYYEWDGSQLKEIGRFALGQ